VKRIAFFVLVAVVLLSLAAVGWILGLARKPEPSLRPTRRGRLGQGASLRAVRRVAASRS
jgi:hypothetical protein